RPFRPDLSTLLAQDVSRPLAFYRCADQALSPAQAPRGGSARWGKGAASASTARSCRAPAPPSREDEEPQARPEPAGAGAVEGLVGHCKRSTSWSIRCYITVRDCAVGPACRTGPGGSPLRSRSASGSYPIAGSHTVT